MSRDSNATSQPLPPGRLAALTIALSLAVFMNALDVSIANVSVPNIAGDLGVSSQHGTWIITSFAAARAILLPITGWMARRVGELRLFVWSTLAFTAFSLLCGLAWSFPVLVAARALQGMAAGPVMPLSQSLLLANFPRHRHGFANGIWAMMIVVGPVLGPILGGWITDNYHWSWIFNLNVPIGMVAALVTWLLLHERMPARGSDHTRIDLVGLVLLAAGVIAVQTLFDQGNDDAWFSSPFIVGCAVVAVVAFAFLLVWELTDASPVLDLALFAQRNFLVATIAITFGYMAYFGGIVVLPLWLQNDFGYTATWAGITTASLGIGAVVFSPIAGRLTDRFDPRLLVTLGFGLFAVLSFVKADANSQITFARLFLTRLPWGIGSACFLIPLLTLSTAGLPPERVAGASGLFNFMRLLAMSFGTSLSQAVWDRRLDLHDHHLTSQIAAYGPNVQAWFERARQAGLTHEQAMAKLSKTISRQSALLGLNDAYWLAGWLFIGLTALIWFARPKE
ncbi:DHA2 family efflux MFS transporter permease subunit [Salinisphaera sp. LB1]|uniref:DHA2 family efflux MFS transporter permease subunit n=1 Tax=Salinisphaera sp. LB1 TaxID=2183911 RepID=UPI000D70509F|nr:DHA2 family efflux MFS transporter permease subunit [Salinisphaera sp. LB1]AWN17283.1 Inner membrane component of tripartite multidrug resistance system [Salinisphaera sp. LB1]